MSSYSVWETDLIELTVFVIFRLGEDFGFASSSQSVLRDFAKLLITDYDAPGF
jgi:hypothetical protein